MTNFRKSNQTGPRNGPRPKPVRVWESVAQRLRGSIRDGTWPAGTQIPTEHELSLSYGVNRHTVRRAIAVLGADGWLRAEQGRGTFVQERHMDYALGPRTRFSEIVVSNEREPAGKLLCARVRQCDALVAARLELALDDAYIEMETLHEADGTPLSISTSWFPGERCDGLIEAYTEFGSITRALSEIGIRDYRRKETLVTAAIVDPADADYLMQSRTRPVLIAESVNVDLDGRPVQFARSRFASDRVQLSVRY